MAAATAQYYFRFPICWCHSIRKVKVYQQTKFRRHISIHGWDITTSVFEKQTSAILEFYFRFRYRPFRRNRRVVLHLAAEFYPNWIIHAEIWYHIDFQDGSYQPCCICFEVMADHHEVPFVIWTRSSNRLFVGLIVPDILRCIDFGVLAWNCLFTPLLGEFFGIFPHMTSSIAMTPKRTVLGRKHVVWAIQRKNRCNGSTWARDREKIQDNKKVTKVLYFPYLGEAPTGPIRPKISMVGNVYDVITCAKFQIEIFMAYDFTGGRIFDFCIDFCMGLTTVQR